MVSEAEPTQPSLRRLKQFNIKPNRELGQNFLIDSNILDVIGGLARLNEDDVVLEIGGGLGVLSEYLAERVKHVHVIEFDTKLEAALRDAVTPYDNVTLHFADAIALDFSQLDPAPNKVVANLPYGIAATVTLKTITELPSVERWVVMTQREVGDRLAAKPGGRAYGISSVLAQLACDVHVERPISRTVFFPVPNVGSALVSLKRHSPGASPALAKLIQGGFAHRRKTLPRSLALATGRDEMRDQVRAALVKMGLPEDVRAERLTPQQFAELLQRLQQR